MENEERLHHFTFRIYWIRPWKWIPTQFVNHWSRFSPRSIAFQSAFLPALVAFCRRLMHPSVALRFVRPQRRAFSRSVANVGRKRIFIRALLRLPTWGRTVLMESTISVSHRLHDWFIGYHIIYSGRKLFMNCPIEAISRWPGFHLSKLRTD